MEAVVLAGGFGTRLKSVIKDMPKPMAPVAGRPFLEYVLDNLISQGIDRIILAVGYKKECIMDHFGTKYRGIEIIYSEENTPLFTGGATKCALKLCRNERVFVLNGDTFFHVDLNQLRRFSLEKNIPFCLAVKDVEDSSRYGALSLSDNGLLSNYSEKQSNRRGYINGGIYDMERTVLEEYPEQFSLERDFIPEMIRDGKAGGVRFTDFFIDIGIPEDYARAQVLLGDRPHA